jgi:NAD(P)-dependent dehydrogenase (short-subunit alcohol dehydrogenase family)
MSTSPNTRSILVTGATGGIGSALVDALAARGDRVFAASRHPAPAADDRIVPLELDIVDAASVETAADRVAEATGPGGLHGLVNGAGMIVQGPLELVPPEALRRQFEVNVLGQVAVTQSVLPLLRRAHGRVVNIGAPTGRVAIPMLGPLAGSKAALESITSTLRMELRHQAISVSIVEPGALETEIFAKAEAQARRDGHAGSPETARLYERAIRAAAEAMAGMKLSPVDATVDAIVHALTDARPRTRYVVGADARRFALLRKLPDGVRDRVLMRTVGLRPGVFSPA